MLCPAAPSNPRNQLENTLQVAEFAGLNILVRKLDSAAAQADPATITTAVRQTLCESIHDTSIRLPDKVFVPLPGHYARRLLYQSAGLGYSVVAMNWGPGQGTHIHDHCGMWCVEGVWQGEVTVTQYQLLEQREERFRFEPVGSMQVGVGSAGSLIPPHEYHVITNPNAHESAITVHVYSGEMSRCNVFEPAGEEWYLRQARHLGYDD